MGCGGVSDLSLRVRSQNMSDLGNRVKREDWVLKLHLWKMSVPYAESQRHAQDIKQERGKRKECLWLQVGRG